jgi:hypothetical protein
MKPHSKSPQSLQTAPQLGAIGLQPFQSSNIRLSSVLCSFGFALRIASEPATVIVDFETQRPAVIFWHETRLPEDSPIKKQLPTLTALHLGLWWEDPDKYSIEGYDDALRAMRRVFEVREWLIGVIKGRNRTSDVRGQTTDGRLMRGSVTTESLHIASVIKACGIDLLNFHKGTFIFGKKAAPIAEAIAGVEARVPTRDESAVRPLNSEGVDPCIDWMLAALKYRDWLHKIVRQHDCIPLVEKRDGERILRISSAMPKTLRREFTRRF